MRRDRRGATALIMTAALAAVACTGRPTEGRDVPPPVASASEQFTRPVFDRIVVALDEDPARGRAESSAALEQRAAGIAHEALGSLWTVTPLDGAPREFVLAPSAAEAAFTVGGAWDAAYGVRERNGVEHAEPLFVVERSPGEEDGDFLCRTSGSLESGAISKPDLEEARLDAEWSLGPHGSNALAAQARIRALGREPGAGIVIAHPDTGFRRHPELWPLNGLPIPVLADQARNFVEGGTDATDPLAPLFPGHGTRTASVIVSPTGNQFKMDDSHFVSGVAPGAQLVPLRVTDSVAMLAMRPLAAAIRHAATPREDGRPRRADVVSISLGGLPSRTLQRAVRDAVANDVIVLAAAGNVVQIVVWPARYDDVIAVAATNAREEPWIGSSRGRDVDVSAPGESVWCAGTRRRGEQTEDCVGMSRGTSFAVATTAGVAALWLDFHRDSEALAALRRSHAVAWGFREVLQSTARPGAGSWDAGRFGPGIVDALALLEAEIPAPPPAAALAHATTPCQEDLATLLSLFEETPEGVARIARLFSLAPSRACDAAPLADEIVFHYVTDDSVGRAFAPLLASSQPGVEDFVSVRSALVSADSSRRLRASLGGVP